MSTVASISSDVLLGLVLTISSLQEDHGHVSHRAHGFSHGRALSHLYDSMASSATTMKISHSMFSVILRWLYPRFSRRSYRVLVSAWRTTTRSNHLRGRLPEVEHLDSGCHHYHPEWIGDHLPLGEKAAGVVVYNVAALGHGILEGVTHLRRRHNE